MHLLYLKREGVSSAQSPKIGLGIVVAGVIACGDGSDSLTIEEYFAEVDEIAVEFEARAEEAFTIIPQDVSDEVFFADESNLSPFKEFAAALPRFFGDWLAQLKALDPPSEVAEQHDNLVAAGEEFVSALDEDSEAVSEAETMAEVEALEAPARTLHGPPGAAIDEACFEMLLVAAENGASLELFCQDDE